VRSQSTVVITIFIDGLVVCWLTETAIDRIEV
jgi:hypothetical protein